jgi:hypothetical protein
MFIVELEKKELEGEFQLPSKQFVRSFGSLSLI